MSKNPNSFGARSTLAVGDKSYEIFRLDVLSKAGIGHVDKLPFSLRVLLENLLRNEDGNAVSKSDIEAVAGWEASATPSVEIAYHPARVILQDFTGVPAVVDLAAMRDAMVALGGTADQINPEQPVDLVIDHSVQVDSYGSEKAFGLNVQMEYLRNRERYLFRSPTLQRRARKAVPLDLRWQAAEGGMTTRSPSAPRISRRLRPRAESIRA